MEEQQDLSLDLGKNIWPKDLGDVLIACRAGVLLKLIQSDYHESEWFLVMYDCILQWFLPPRTFLYPRNLLLDRSTNICIIDQ